MVDTSTDPCRLDVREVIPVFTGIYSRAYPAMAIIDT
jgi:hypothetical protein